MQTILGAGGAIGKPLARSLAAYTDAIRLVSRNPVRINPSDELFPLDAQDLAGLDKAIAGSSVVYVVIGFEYRLKVWQEFWPPFMKAVIKACKNHGAKLVFFDNVYMYASSAIPHMTEVSPLSPPSKKGIVRLKLHELVMNAAESGYIETLIARSADFYGPENRASALQLMVADNLIKGKKAQAFGDIDKIHTYTYTPDGARATALLGNSSDSWNQVWHVPTTHQPLTNRQWIELVAKELQQAPAVQIVQPWMIRLLGLFVPIMREFPEMLYQYNQDYVFDSSKFEKQFGLKATTPEAGVKEMIAQLLKKA